MEQVISLVPIHAFICLRNNLTILVALEMEGAESSYYHQVKCAKYSNYLSNYLSINTHALKEPHLGG